MDIQNFISQLTPEASGYLTTTLMVLAILIFGWMIAKFVHPYGNCPYDRIRSIRGEKCT